MLKSKLIKKDAKSILRAFILILFFLLIIIYALNRSQNLILGVKIKNVNLKDGMSFTENIIEITGNAKNAIYLTLNNREININSAGDFREDFSLLPGYNIITIEAKDKFQKTDLKNYQLMYLK